MSLFGLVVLLMLLVHFALYVVTKIRSGGSVPALPQLLFVLLIFIQLLFIFNEGFSLYEVTKPEPASLASLFLTVAINAIAILAYVKYRKSDFFKIVVLVFVIFGLVYTEYFNGAYSFHNYNNYIEYHSSLKKYHKLFPFKILKQGNHPDLDNEAEVILYSGFMVFPTGIKKDDGKLFYYVPRGFGESGNWFQYGIPPGQQL